MTIHLSLPPLAPGDPRPTHCPHCGGKVIDAQYGSGGRSRCGAAVEYEGALKSKTDVAPAGGWGYQWRGVCSRPSPAAVLRACLAALTPEQRGIKDFSDTYPNGKRYEFRASIDGESADIGEFLELAADALEGA